MKKTLLFAGLALFLSPVAAHALDFAPTARFNVQGSYSGIASNLSNTGSLGANGDIFILPALHQGNWTLLPLFAAIGQTAVQALDVDSFFVEQYTFLAKPQLRYQHGDDASYKIWATAKRAINKETSDEAWSEGLYDYEEFGAGIGGTWKNLLHLPVQESLGVEPLHRTYVNYHELGVATLGGKNYYTHDYDGWKWTAGLESLKGAPLAWSVDYTLLFRDYTDAYLYNTDGTFDLNDLRRDQLHIVDLDLAGPWRQNFTWDVNGNVTANISNQGNFDLTAAPFQYEADFYGYDSVTLGLGFTWYPQGPKGPSLTPSYAITNITYTGRLVRWADGTYTQSKQADLDNRVGLDGRWPFSSWAALSGGLTYLSQQSNQTYIYQVQNAYDLFKVNLGVDLSY